MIIWLSATLRSGWSVCIGSGRVLSVSACICHAGWLQLKPHCQEKVEYVPPSVSLSDFSLFSLWPTSPKDSWISRIFLSSSGLRCVSTAALEWGSYPDAPVETKLGGFGMWGSWSTKLKGEWKESLCLWEAAATLTWLCWEFFVQCGGSFQSLASEICVMEIRES